jgi:hypothetical protein
MRCYSHLSDDEREQIGLAKALGHSIDESADDDRGWAALALALRGGLHSPDELLHSGERLRRVLWKQ